MTESSPERPVLEPTRFHRMQIVEGGNLRLTPLDAEGLPAGDPVTFEADYVGIETWTPTSSSPEAPVPEPCEPLLGCASTRSLIAELHARAEVADRTGETWPAYRTVDEPPSPAVRPPVAVRPVAVDQTVRAAKAVVDFLDDPEVPRNRYRDGQAGGAVRVWAEMLGMPNDFARAIGLARVHVLDAEMGAGQ